MKIALINPPLEMKMKPSQIYYPTGLLYVASALQKQRDYEVCVVDAPVEGYENFFQHVNWDWYRGLSHNQIIARLINFNPDVIGISTTFSVNAPSVYKLSDILKKYFEVPIIYGGPHASVKPNDCLEHCDCVVVGEGEKTTITYIEDLIYDNLKSSIIISEPIQDLDSLAFPARDLIPMKKYFESAKDSLIHGVRGMERWASMITSRGCPYNCCFCSIHLTMGRQWRARSSDNVMAEISHLIQKYGITDITFEDDNLSFDPRRLVEICWNIIAHGYKLNLYVPNGLRADTLDKELLGLMFTAGFKELWIAPESGSQRVVNEVIGKSLDLSEVERVVTEGTEMGLNISCFFVIGFPDETLEEMRETIEFGKKLKKLGMHRHSIGFATPYWGTELYWKCFKEDLLVEGFSDESVSPSSPSIKSPNWTIDQLKQVRKEMVF